MASASRYVRRVVGLEGDGDVIHGGVQEEAVKEEFGPTGLSIDSIDFHVAPQSLL